MRYEMKPPHFDRWPQWAKSGRRRESLTRQKRSSAHRSNINGRFGAAASQSRHVASLMRRIASPTERRSTSRTGKRSGTSLVVCAKSVCDPAIATKSRCSPDTGQTADQSCVKSFMVLRPKLIVLAAFDTNDEGELVPAFEPQQVDSEDKAKRKGQAIAHLHTGVIAWSRTADLVNCEFGDPEIIFQHGTIPHMD